MDDREMLDESERIGELLFKYIRKIITDDELTELYNWVYESKENEEVFEHVVYSQEFQDSITEAQQTDVDAAYLSIQNKLGIKPAKVAPLPERRRRYFIAAAASVALVIAISAVLYFRMHAQKSLNSPVALQSNINDAAPGGNRAVLTLSNGSSIVLDDAEDGVLTQQGSTKVIKLTSGQLAYTTVTHVAEAAAYNTLSTPRGGQYQIALPDGTKVWLNNASSLRYPVAFSGHAREVELQGEAYFEVVHMNDRPFRVKTKNCIVEDIGTRFNIKAYPDEESIKTTVAQGSVKIGQTVQNGNKNPDVILTPGQQAQVAENIKVVTDANVDEVIAWKNGYFNFDRADIREVMRQLSRWYDVNVQYKGDITTHHFDGRIQRELVLSKVLTGLENKEAHFSIEGRKIVITSGL